MKKQSVILSVLILGGLFSPPLAFAAVPKQAQIFPEGERLLYTRLVEAYRHGLLEDVIQQRKSLERNFPNSIHLDNAYYLSGMLEFQRSHLGEAIRDFQIVRHRFALSNKRPAALVGIAMTYERLNLNPLAKEVFSQVVEQYPGSPESARATMHLRMQAQAKAGKSGAVSASH